MQICIKKICGKQFEGEDPDYCPACREVNKELATKIDAQIKEKGISRSTFSRLQFYDSLPKGPGGFPYAKSFI